LSIQPLHRKSAGVSTARKSGDYCSLTRVYRDSNRTTAARGAWFPLAT